MPDSLQKRFSDRQLTQILEEAVIYMCACPAQVAKQLLELRNLFAYQRRCIQSEPMQAEVHRRIAEATAEAHARLEQCLDDVLTLEGWDREHWRMPEGLRLRRDALALNPDDGAGSH